MNYIISIIVFVTLTYIVLFYIYNYVNNYVLYKSLNIEGLKFLTFDYFKDVLGDKKVYMIVSTPETCQETSVDLDFGKIKETTFKEYITKYMQDKSWYIKAEDYYDILGELNIRDKIISTFAKIFPHKYIDEQDLSFWMGGKGSITVYHTDMDDLSYLYIVKGKKKVQLIEPKYTKYMYLKKKYSYYSLWSEVDFQNPDYKKHPLFKNVKIHEFILNEGDALFIPRNWWHSVENLEDTIAITYKVFQPWYDYFITYPEHFRKIKCNLTKK